MRKGGIILSVGSIVGFVVCFWDLFGAKNWPIPLTVTGVIVGSVGAFVGPAVAVFPVSDKRRKKISFRSLLISMFIIAIGWVCKSLHFLGAGVEIFVGILMFCFFYGTLAFKNKYEKWKIYTRSKRDAFFLSLFDYLGIGALALGVLFKKQHWPLAEEMAMIGLGTLAIGVIAWNQKFKKEVVFRKEAEDKLKDLLLEVEAQKHKVEEKQKEIIDSINYAKRIQKSHMATEKYIVSTLNRLRRN